MTRERESHASPTTPTQPGGAGLSLRKCTLVRVSLFAVLSTTLLPAWRVLEGLQLDPPYSRLGKYLVTFLICGASMWTAGFLTHRILAALSRRRSPSGNRA